MPNCARSKLIRVFRHRREASFGAPVNRGDYFASVPALPKSEPTDQHSCGHTLFLPMTFISLTLNTTTDATYFPSTATLS